ncbi:MAG TPA: hypothetical protein VFI97_07535, partial [Arthrobacter sp.]|nr:hypothetical protein [Arthrobacter sp.]
AVKAGTSHARRRIAAALKRRCEKDAATGCITMGLDTSLSTFQYVCQRFYFATIFSQTINHRQPTGRHGNWEAPL